MCPEHASRDFKVQAEFMESIYKNLMRSSNPAASLVENNQVMKR